MRSLFLVSLLIGLAISGTVFALNAPSVQGGNPDNWYTEVEYYGTTGASQSAEHGNVLMWDVNSHDGVHVSKCNTADSELVAGIVPTSSDYSCNLDSLGRPLKDGDKFLMQIHGYAHDVPTDGNAAVGSAIGSEAAGSVGDGDGMGVALETDAADTGSPTGTSGDVYLTINGGAL